MSISFVAVSISDELTKNVGPKPTGTAEGDFMLAFVWAYEETVTDAPDDWTFDGTQHPLETSDVQGEPELFNSYLYWKRAGASEPADYTWETTTATGPSPNRRVVIVSYRGVHEAVDPIAGITTNHTNNGGVGFENPETLEMANVSLGLGVPRKRYVILAAVGTPDPTATMVSPFVERLDQDGNFVFDRVMFTANTGVSVLTFPNAMTSFGRGVMLDAALEEPGDRHYCGSIDTQIN